MASALMAALVVAVSAGCGLDTSSDATTDSGVALPESPGEKQAVERLFHGYYRELLEIGTKPFIARCYEREVRSLPPAALRRFVTGKASGETLARYNSQFYDNCVPAGTSAVDSSVSGSQLERTRELLKEALNPVLESEGASPTQIECVEGRIDDLPPAELKALTGAQRDVAEAVGKSIFRDCGLK
ncbi:MAG TPA: hypothetical protein VFM51_10770 [Solirubrobacterales bacterium]|nr:hypothetical protein [Solirubrobacterales bacterium]